MDSCDLNVIQGVVKTQPETLCLLSGQPGTLTPLVLRRMLLFPGVWIGWSAEIHLPLVRPRSLAAWQYLRMFRPSLLQ